MRSKIDDTVSVFMRREMVSRDGLVGNEEAFLPIFPYGGRGQADFPRENANGNCWGFRLALPLSVSHKLFYCKMLWQTPIP